MTADDSAFMRVLRGQTAHPAPIWLMRQAGRYLPEYRATRATAGGFLDLCFTPELATEVTLQPIRRFGFDAAILFSDILVIPWALGQDLDFVEGVGPVLTPITDEAGFDRLESDGFLERLAPVFEAIRRIKQNLPAGVPLIGFAGAPWTLATYMIAGRGTPDQAPAKALATDNPALFAKIMRLLERCCAEFLAAQAEAGVDAVKLFDSWAGGAPADQIDSIVIEPAATIAENLRSRVAAPIIMFPRLLGREALLRFAARVRPDGLALDQSVDMAWAAAEVQGVKALQGNLDPALMKGALEPLREALVRLRAEVGDRPHILNLGHGITPDSKIENVEFLIKTWRELE